MCAYLLNSHSALITNSSQCAFFKLPGELRNMIYELVVTGPIIYIAQAVWNRKELLVRISSATDRAYRPAETIFNIRMVCHQIAYETRDIVEIFFRNNTFSFCNESALMYFRHCVSHSRRALIQSVQLDWDCFFFLSPRMNQNIRNVNVLLGLGEIMPSLRRVYIVDPWARSTDARGRWNEALLGSSSARSTLEHLELVYVQENAFNFGL